MGWFCIRVRDYWGYWVIWILDLGMFGQKLTLEDLNLYILLSRIDNDSSSEKTWLSWYKYKACT